MTGPERLRALADATTPGDWFVDRQEAAPLRILADDDRRTIICTVSGPATNHWSQAEAQLIASSKDVFNLAADLAEALARRVEEDECGLDEPGTECVWCHEDRALLARLDGVAAGKEGA